MMNMKCILLNARMVKFASTPRQPNVTRLRPILMTALAFVIGLIPLVIASGAGANARRSLGTTVVGGLAVATILIIFVPIFYYAIQKFRERKSPKQDSDPATESRHSTSSADAKHEVT